MRFREYQEKIQKYYRSFENSITLNLQPATTFAKLQAVQARMHTTFPDELLDIMEECNGQSEGFPIFPKLYVGTFSHDLSDPHWIVPLEDIEFDTKILNEEFMDTFNSNASDAMFRLKGPVGIHTKYIQFTETGGAGFLAFDGKPAEGGSINQVVYICTQPLEVVFVSNNLSDLYNRVIKGFENDAIEYHPNEPYPHYRFQEKSR